jgi:hypothetical protein
LANDINQRIDAWAPKLQGSVPHQKIRQSLHRCLKPFDVKIALQPEHELEAHQVCMSGLFDSEIESRNITITLHFGTCVDEFIFDEYSWSEFRFQLSQVVQHELLHRSQSERRQHLDNPCTLYYDVKAGAKSDKDQMDYLAEFDEIDAYAHDIAMEIKYYYPRQDPYEILGSINRRRKVWSWNYYARSFRHSSDWSEVRNRLLKKAYQWLPHVTV